MSAALKTQKLSMDVEAFLEWTLHQHGDEKYELFNGEPIAMAPQTFAHADAKFQIARACAAAIEAKGLPCRVIVDGLGVRASSRKLFIPDIAIQCGGPIGLGERILENPVVVIEVISDSTRDIDTGRKFIGYFNQPSLCHYLIVDPVEREAVHHRRGADGIIVSTAVIPGPIRLDPPGFDIAGLFGVP